MRALKRRGTFSKVFILKKVELKVDRIYCEYSALKYNQVSLFDLKHTVQFTPFLKGLITLLNLWQLLLSAARIPEEFRSHEIFTFKEIKLCFYLNFAYLCATFGVMNKKEIHSDREILLYGHFIVPSRT